VTEYKRTAPSHREAAFGRAFLSQTRPVVHSPNPVFWAFLTEFTAGFVREVTEKIPPRRDTTFFDVVLPRFALRVKPPRRPGGEWAALYFVRYPSPSGRQRRLKVADPKIMSLDEARDAARAQLAIADSGSWARQN
jgi:hypothetical protein